MLKLGDESPDFTVKLTNLKPFNLYSTLMKSSVLINFIRGTWCEECTDHLKRIESWSNKLNNHDKKVTTIIITVEKENKVKAWLNDNPTSYLMSADEEGLVAKLFGLMVPEDAYSKPGLLLIDSQKIIRLISPDLIDSERKVEDALKS